MYISRMKTTVYTSIPDTTDANYWAVVRQSSKDRTTVYVPKDRVLHKELLTKQWEKIQESLPPKLRAKYFKATQKVSSVKVRAQGRAKYLF